MLRNVFAKTVRDQERSLLWWAIGLAGLVALYAFVYPTVRDKPELNKLIEDYPDVIKALIGGGASIDFTSPAGYLSTELFSFIVPLVLLIFAIGLGANAIAGEEDRKTIDLLLANPISRERLVAEKFGALVLLVAGLGLGLWLALVVFTSAVGMEIGSLRLAEAVASAVLLALHFGVFSLLVGCLTGRRALSLVLAAGAAILAYVVNALALLVDFLEPYRKFSPFYHYVGNEPLRHGLGPDHVAVLLGATAGMALLSVLAFRRRDVAA